MDMLGVSPAMRMAKGLPWWTLDARGRARDRLAIPSTDVVRMFEKYIVDDPVVDFRYFDLEWKRELVWALRVMPCMCCRE